jgi:hypothetical protein
MSRSTATRCRSSRPLCPATVLRPVANSHSPLPSTGNRIGGWDALLAGVVLAAARLGAAADVPGADVPGADVPGAGRSTARATVQPVTRPATQTVTSTPQ